MSVRLVSSEGYEEKNLFLFASAALLEIFGVSWLLLYYSNLHLYLYIAFFVYVPVFKFPFFIDISHIGLGATLPQKSSF